MEGVGFVYACMQKEWQSHLQSCERQEAAGSPGKSDAGNETDTASPEQSPGSCWECGKHLTTDSGFLGLLVYLQCRRFYGSDELRQSDSGIPA